MAKRSIPHIPVYRGRDHELAALFKTLREAFQNIVDKDFVTEKDIYCHDIHISEDSIYMGPVRLKMDKHNQVVYVCYQGEEYPLVSTTHNPIPYVPSGIYDPVPLGYMEDYVAAEVAAHSTPTYLRISATGQAAGDVHLSDATNWAKNEAMIKQVSVETASVDWDLYILQNDNGYSVNDANIPAKKLFIG